MLIGGPMLSMCRVINMHSGGHFSKQHPLSQPLSPPHTITRLSSFKGAYYILLNAFSIIEHWMISESKHFKTNSSKNTIFNSAKNSL